MDWLLSIITWIMGVGMGIALSYLWRTRRARKPEPVRFRRIDDPKVIVLPEDLVQRNITAEAAAEEREPARQTTARFHPRIRNYTTKRNS